MKELGRFDPDHEMFVEAPKELNLNWLRFMRFKAERGDFGPKPVSVPKGEQIFRLSQNELVNYAMQQADRELNGPVDQKMRQHIAANGDY